MANKKTKAARSLKLYRIYPVNLLPGSRTRYMRESRHSELCFAHTAKQAANIVGDWWVEQHVRHDMLEVVKLDLPFDEQPGKAGLILEPAGTVGKRLFGKGFKAVVK